MSLIRKCASLIRGITPFVRPGTSTEVLTQRCLCTSASSDPQRHPEFTAQVKDLHPSDSFLSILDDVGRRKFALILEELEIFVYMDKFVPPSIPDSMWLRLLESQSVRDRVDLIMYHSVKARRQQRETERQASNQEQYKARLAGELVKFESGGMGYGPDMYQLVHNPLRNRKKVQGVEGSRIATSLRVGTPQIAVDMQFIAGEMKRNQSLMATQLQYMISENFESRVPLPMTLCNLSLNADNKTLLDRMVGFYGGQYTNQTILPFISDKGIKETFPDDKQIVYITKSARDIIDGPLTADVYSICLSPDTRKESLGAARRAKIRAVRLPIQKYIRWQSGPMNVPYNNMMRMLRHVYSSGGDWETALRNNISKRHLMPQEEREELGHTSRRRERSMEKTDLIRTICEATGHE